ncbi:MAG: TfoX/Sxy family protein [Pseudonocardia sp.]
MAKHALPRDTAVVVYDVDMADRLREILGSEPGVVEKPMFGGLAFMVAGHMAVSASRQGGLLLRVDPAQTDILVVDPRASRFVMRGREMDGWLRILQAGIDYPDRYPNEVPPRTAGPRGRHSSGDADAASVADRGGPVGGWTGGVCRICGTSIPR